MGMSGKVQVLFAFAAAADWDNPRSEADYRPKSGLGVGMMAFTDLRQVISLV